MKHSVYIILVCIVTALTFLFACDNSINNEGGKNERDTTYYTIERGKIISDTVRTINEKLLCKVDSSKMLIVTHKNVIFDASSNVKVAAAVTNGNIVINEEGCYGKSGIYQFYTIKCNIGVVEDGDYVIIVKRNNNIRGMFPIKIDNK